MKKREIETIIAAGLKFKDLSLILDRAQRVGANNPHQAARSDKRTGLDQVYRFYRSALQNCGQLDLPIGKLGHNIASGILTDFGEYYER